MTSRLNEPVDIRHLAEFSSCPNFARYNWNNSNKQHDPVYQATKEIILGCYKDMQNLERKIKWATIRGRVHKYLAPHFEDVPISKYLGIAKRFMEQIRSWYLLSFRDGPTTCLLDLEVESSVPAAGLRVTGGIGVVALAEPGLVSIIEVTNKFKDKREAFRDFELRSKVWLLKRNGIDVSGLTVINVRDAKIEVWNYQIHDLDNFIYKTERAIQVVSAQIKQQMFYPSISEACNSCPYRRICQW